MIRSGKARRHQFLPGSCTQSLSFLRIERNPEAIAVKALPKVSHEGAHATIPFDVAIPWNFAGRRDGVSFIITSPLAFESGNDPLNDRRDRLCNLFGDDLAHPDFTPLSHG
jgi:hypothetical protein